MPSLQLYDIKFTMTSPSSDLKLAALRPFAVTSPRCVQVPRPGAAEEHGADLQPVRWDPVGCRSGLAALLLYLAGDPLAPDLRVLRSVEKPRRPGDKPRHTHTHTHSWGTSAFVLFCLHRVLKEPMATFIQYTGAESHPVVWRNFSPIRNQQFLPRRRGRHRENLLKKIQSIN